jgi:hypothetical protein
MVFACFDILLLISALLLITSTAAAAAASPNGLTQGRAEQYTAHP